MRRFSTRRRNHRGHILGHGFDRCGGGSVGVAGYRRRAVRGLLRAEPRRDPGVGEVEGSNRGRVAVLGLYIQFAIIFVVARPLDGRRDGSTACCRATRKLPIGFLNACAGDLGKTERTSRSPTAGVRLTFESKLKTMSQASSALWPCQPLVWREPLTSMPS